MSTGTRIVDFSLRRYRLVAGVTVAATAVVAILAALPSLAPGSVPGLKAISVDTDPENMLSASEPVRVFHNRMKEQFGLHDMVVVGVVNDQDPEGVFNPASLKKVYELTEFAKRLSGERIGEEPGQGVIEPDVLSISEVDSVEPIGQGTVSVHRLMPVPPATQADAMDIRRQAMRVPFLYDTIVSRDGKAVAIYLPLTRKDLSYRVYSALREKVAELGGPEQFHITGLPVAEDVFGVEMFIQMAISAPAAMVVIFVLMLLFFRKLVLVISPMIVAMVSVILTMGALVIAGFPIHIMSSMIPIFIMPIAVLDSIHIISEFFEKYQATRDRAKTMKAVMAELFTPMLYTSLTSAAGFSSLALTPIPPVQVFGVFVATGIMAAWVLTVVFIPAFVMFIPERTLANFGATHKPGEAAGPERGSLGRFLHWMGGATYRRAKVIVSIAVVVFLFAGYGISRIRINDNPVKWFTESHPIRVADRVLNAHFGGTYMAYLSLDPEQAAFDPCAFGAQVRAAATTRAKGIEDLLTRAVEVAGDVATQPGGNDARLDKIYARLNPDRSTADDEQLAVWSVVQTFLDRQYGSPDANAAAWTASLAGKAGKLSRGVRAGLGALSGPIAQAVAAEPNTPRAFVAVINRALAPPQQEAPPAPADAPPPIDDAGPSLPSGMDESGPALPSGMDDGGPALPSGIGGAEQPNTPAASFSNEPKVSTAALAALADRQVRGAVNLFLDDQAASGDFYKQPRYLREMRRIEHALGAGDPNSAVGKSNSLATIVTTINRDLHGGDPNWEIIPNSRRAVVQCIDQFISGSRGDRDLWHFVTHDWRQASVWVQLTSGDNKDMSAVVARLDATRRAAGILPASAEGVPPAESGNADETSATRADRMSASLAEPPVAARWFGLTYINVVWQDKMVTGMLEAFAGSFLVVLLMMIVMFRSGLWGLLSMIPLTVTIAAIYGAVGLVGKDYDMPVAVLSSLTLGLAVDFAIHFLARARESHARLGSWAETAPTVFGEPARAITRNIIVIAAGFLPLLLAPLVPYKTVGVLLATILLVSGVATLLLLPALIRLLEPLLFPRKAILGVTCNCMTCLLAALALAGVVIVNLRQYLELGWNVLAVIGAGIVLAMAAACGLSSRRHACKLQPATQEKES